MRKFGIIIAAIAVLLLSSCVREIDLPQQDGSQQPCELTPLTISTGEMTKTSLSGSIVNWSDDDMIAVFDDLHYNNRFNAVQVDGPRAVFEGKVTARATDLYAVYPYSDALNATDESIFVTLPSQQTAVAGSFAEEHNISIAHATKPAEADVVNGVVFENICALIKFTIPKQLDDVAEVAFTANNRNLAGDLAVSKSDMCLSCLSGDQTVTMKGDFKPGETYYFVVTPGIVDGFSTSAKTKDGANYNRTSVKSFELRAGAIINLGDIVYNADPSAAVRHTYDASGVLTGTEVMIDFDLPAGVKEYVTSFTARMVNSAGEVYRIISKTSAPDNAMMEQYSNKVFIPSNNGEKYSINYLYTLNGKDVTGKVEVTVPKPEFTVSASAYTSYNKYRSYCESNNTQYLNEANACDGSSMYDINCSVSISEQVLKQFGLAYCSAELKLNGSSYMKVESTSGNDVNASIPAFYSLLQCPNLQWGEYSLRAEATFDGVTRSASKILNVTGVPYKALPPANSGVNAWSGSAYSWNSDYVRLHKHTISQTFHAPGNIGVTVYQNARIHTRSDDCTYEVFLSGNKLYSISQSSFFPATKTTEVSESYSSTMSSSNPVLTLSNSYGTVDAVLEYTNVKVYEVSVKYN